MSPLARLGQRCAGALALCLALAGCEKSIDLQTGLTDTEANEIVSVLREDGIAAGKTATKDGVKVNVPEAALPRATTVLEARGLPKRRQSLLGEVFKKEGLISSPLEERARYIYALSQEMEYTLGQIDGVIVARVHVVLPEKVAPGEPVLPSSAAIFIKHKPDLDPDLIGPRVRQLVARSIPGLGAAAKEKISVVLIEGHPEPPRKPAPDNGENKVIAALAALLLLLSAAAGGLWYARRNNVPLPWLDALLKRAPQAG